MRIFVAVELGEALRQEAARVAGELAEVLGQEARRAVTWVAPEKMHLTVRFIGEAGERTVKELVRRIAAPFDEPAFRLAVGGSGVFPRSGPPRVIWLGITEGAEALARLHDEIEARLEGLGLERDTRPFRAHLTLGRVKAAIGPATRQAVAAMRSDTVGTCEIGDVTLFDRELSPRGPSYTALARGRLR
jgi:2'-5' RNA ligase